MFDRAPVAIHEITGVDLPTFRYLKFEATSRRCSKILKGLDSLSASFLDRHLVRIFLALSITISPILNSACCLAF